MQDVVHNEHLEQDHWWFRARRSIFTRVLDEQLPGGRAPRILDLGPGSGVNLPILAPRGRVTALDLSDVSLARCRAAGDNDQVLADATVAPFKSNTFDLVCALDVLEHIDDDRAALVQIERVLRPGGLFLFSVPAFGFLWGRQDVLSHHKRRYAKSELRQRVTATGLEIEHLTYFNTLLFPPIAAVRVLMRPMLERSVAKGGSDLSVKLPLGLDQVLYQSFACERGWVTRHSLPFGVSMLGWARKRADAGDAGGAAASANGSAR
ncbi:putative S-adenosylmethionine-dependent methyltransferase/MSMEI_2290 [Planctomycetes bacterium Pla163]|uniref:Putative S-adenosylmethionine-dependent methyltransferase/MSMEI_2290 n=1 Tax=Rohdeia mirabilis TaxID=2528008 RepID=A0A518CVR6_9BACT|nr:putative S-adenosylmethionine-dependent methyltransferase/MSMEI_2290 [Planctomycetes bacterium Pla163]